MEHELRRGARSGVRRVAPVSVEVDFHGRPRSDSARRRLDRRLGIDPRRPASQGTVGARPMRGGRVNAPACNERRLSAPSHRQEHQGRWRGSPTRAQDLSARPEPEWRKKPRPTSQRTRGRADGGKAGVPAPMGAYVDLKRSAPCRSSPATRSRALRWRRPARRYTSRWSPSLAAHQRPEMRRTRIASNPRTIRLIPTASRSSSASTPATALS